jgi:hypothetical protein
VATVERTTELLPWGTTTAPEAALQYCAQRLCEEDNLTVNQLAEDLTRSLLAQFTMPELLGAFATLHPKYHELTPRLALIRLINLTPWNAPLTDTLVTLSTMSDLDARTLAHEVMARRDALPRAVLLGSELGLLKKWLYDILVDPRQCPRSRYLTLQLRALPFSASQMTLARTLCPEWVGTMNELEATVRTLRPS